MPRYKLSYFNARGAAEPTRITLALAGADWEDFRVEDWKSLKESGICPYGQIPILEVEGTAIAQSVAILRYVAKEHGLAPQKNLQLAIADGICDQIHDIHKKILNMHFEKNAEKKEELSKDIHEKILPENMKYFEKILEGNCQGNTFFFGEKITYADIHLFAFLNGNVSGKMEVPELLQKYPGLTKLYNGVMNESSILAYLKKRPQTEF